MIEEEKLTIDEISTQIYKLIHTQFNILRQSDDLDKTMTEIVNLFLRCFSICTLNTMIPVAREKWSEDAFPGICTALRLHLKKAILDLEEAERETENANIH